MSLVEKFISGQNKPINITSRECFGQESLQQVSPASSSPHKGIPLIEGEVLWSGRQDADGVNRTLPDAAIRLEEFRERMVVRGIEAEPFTQQWCVQRRGECSFPEAAA